MAVYAGPRKVNSPLVMHLEASTSKSYPGSGTLWTDLSGNGNNVTLLGGVSYDSSRGALSFDGVDDSAYPTISHSYLSSSALEVVFRSSNHGTGNKMIFGYRHNAGYSIPTLGSIYLNGSTLSASVITTSQVWRVATIASPILTNTIYHVVLNKDTTNGKLQLFLNGIPGAVQTFDVTTYAQWPSVGNFIGANTLDIAKSTNTNVGQGWSTDYFNGMLYSLSVYSRTLSEDEVLNSFDAMKGRFGY